MCIMLLRAYSNLDPSPMCARIFSLRNTHWVEGNQPPINFIIVIGSTTSHLYIPIRKPDHFFVLGSHSTFSSYWGPTVLFIPWLCHMAARCVTIHSLKSSPPIDCGGGASVASSANDASSRHMPRETGAQPAARVAPEKEGRPDDALRRCFAVSPRLAIGGALVMACSPAAPAVVGQATL